MHAVISYLDWSLHASSSFKADSPLLETAENDGFGAELSQVVHK